MKRALAGLAGLVLLVGCQESPRGGMPVSGPSFDISESRAGGNPDLFFSQPLAPTPQAGDAGFDEGAANDVLVPYVRICETDGAESSAGCVTDVTAAVTGAATGLAMTFNASGEVYQVGWHTRDLDVAKNYRIEIWGIAFWKNKVFGFTNGGQFITIDPNTGAPRLWRPWRPHTERELLVPGEIYELFVEVFPVSHVFHPGHELVVNREPVFVVPSWFSLLHPVDQSVAAVALVAPL